MERNEKDNSVIERGHGSVYRVTYVMAKSKLLTMIISCGAVNKRLKQTGTHKHTFPLSPSPPLSLPLSLSLFSFACMLSIPG